MGYQESTSPSTMSGGERDSGVRSMNEGRNGGVNLTAQSFNPSNIENGATESPEKETEEQQRKRRGRKGHSKSRRGCFNCKRARIKVPRTIILYLFRKITKSQDSAKRIAHHVIIASTEG